MPHRIDRIHDLVSAAAAAVPDRLALVSPDGTSTTFAQLDRDVRSVAGWVSQVTDRGGRVAVIADNGADYARLYYGVPAAGRVLVLVNQRLSVDEQVAQLAATRPAVVLGDQRYLDPLRHAGPTVAFTDAEWSRALEHRPDRPDVSAEDPAWWLFTSGSTGAPKPVVHTHRSISTAVRGTVSGRSVRSGGVYLLPFPMCHIAGYNMLVQHAAFSTVLPVPAFRPESFVEAVNTHGVTSCSLAPTMLHSLLEYLAGTDVRLPTLREIAYGSAAIPADLLRRAIERLNVDFHQGYGMTEAGGNVTFLGPDEHRAGAAGDAAALRSAGRPHAEVDVRFAADSGEIQFRGAQFAPALVESDGWFRTGDVGRLDDSGRLVVTDRLKDVIITGGENVSSREVEDVLSTHPDVDAVAVVGVPDDYWGEAICAVVVPRSGSAPSIDELIAHSRAHLAGFKRPRRVLFVDALPVTTNGKVSKAAVREFARRSEAGGR